MVKGDIVYYARIFPKTGTFEVDELRIRTVEETYFVGTEKDSRQAFLFSYDAMDDEIFLDRDEALAKVKQAEKENKNKKQF